MVSACFKKVASVNNDVGSSLSKFKDFAGEITIFIYRFFSKLGITIIFNNIDSKKYSKIRNFVLKIEI